MTIARRAGSIGGYHAKEWMPSDMPGAIPSEIQVGQTIHHGYVYLAVDQLDDSAPQGSRHAASWHSSDQARQFAYAILDACDEAERRLQSSNPEAIRLRAQQLINDALNPTSPAADGDTIVRSIN